MCIDEKLRHNYLKCVNSGSRQELVRDTPEIPCMPKISSGDLPFPQSIPNIRRNIYKYKYVCMFGID